MSTLVLDVGIAVMFLVVWGFVIVGGYFFGRNVVEEPTLWVSNSTVEIRSDDPRRSALPGRPR